MRTLEGVVRISATDGFSAYIAAPAAAEVQRRHPKVAVEIVTATRRATQQRSGLDIEVVVGEPQVHRAEAIRLGDYRLGLYGSRGLPGRARRPGERRRPGRGTRWSTSSTRCCQVDDLDLARSFAPTMRESVTSTNVFVHVEATRAAAGLGLLPCFMADRHRRPGPGAARRRRRAVDLLAGDPRRDAAPAGGGRGRRGDPGAHARPARRAAGAAAGLRQILAPERHVLVQSGTCPSSTPTAVPSTTGTGPAAEPRAAVIFLHGFGEHTGLYHRYGFALNAAGIDLWAVDQSATA